MVFMNGSPIHPLCINSKRLISVLSNYPKCMEELEYFDLVIDPDIVKCLISYSNYEEIP
jgi:glutaredoxin-related protein